jgi:multidrug efflux pump
VPEFLVMGVTIGILPLLAYSFGKGDGVRLRSALRGGAVTVGVIMLLFAGTVLLFRTQVFTAFVSNPSLLAIGVTILTAQLVSSVFNGFTGLLTSLFQATGRALPSIVVSMAQGVLFIPTVLLFDAWFGLGGIIWSLTVSEGLVLVAALIMWAASRRAINAGLAEGSPERAEAVLEQQEA